MLPSSTHRAASLVIVVALVAPLFGVFLPAPAAAAAGPAAAELSPELAARLQAAGPAEVLEAILLLDHDVAQADLEAAVASGLAVTPPLRSLPAFGVRGTAAALRAYLADGGVAWAEWNAPLAYHMETARVATRAGSVDANVPAMGGPLLLDGVPVDGRGVGIAIVDGGVDATHPDLPWGTKVRKNMNFVCTTPGLISTATQYCFGNWVQQGQPSQPDGFCNEPLWVDAPTSDHSSGHGTHVGGIAAGSGAASGGLFRGVAPGATLYGLNTGEAIAVLFSIEAFDWILCNHDKVDPPIKVVNNSWGTPPSASGCSPAAGYDQPSGGITRLLVDQMVARGITVVFSSGNSGGTGAVVCNSPQSRIPTPGVIGVANQDDDDRGNRDGPLSGSSSRGLNSAARADTWPDVSAPGTFITATMSRTGHTVNAPIAFATPEHRFAPNYVTISGTSMSAPHVAGIAALMLQANPALTPAQVEDILEDTAYKFAFGGAYLFDPANPDDTSSFDKGHGLADARAAVLAAAALAAKVPGDTPAQPPVNLNGQRLYLRTAPSGLGNVDGDYQNWESAAPSKVPPSAWHDIEPLLNADFWEIPTLFMPGGVTVTGQDVHFRFWAGGGAGADGTNATNPASWRVSLRIGSFVSTQVAREAAPAWGPRQYDVTWPAVTASGTSLKIVIDSASSANTAAPTASSETNFGNALLYDSIYFPTSVGIGVAAAAPPALPGSQNQACIQERPGACWATIQLAVDNANDGETVLVAPAVYVESVAVHKRVAVQSIAGAELTRIRSPQPGTDTVAITAAGASLRGFTVLSTSPGGSAALVRVAAPDVTVAQSTIVAGGGVGVRTQGAGGVTLAGNAIGAGTGVLLAGGGASRVAGNVLSSLGDGVATAAGAGAAVVEGNAFARHAVHLADPAGAIDVAAAAGANSFDRLARVDAGGLTRALYGDAQAAIDAAAVGSAVLLRGGTFREALQVRAGKDGLRLCGSADGRTCGGAAAVVDATGLGFTALKVRANDVVAEGLVLRLSEDAGAVVDADGTQRFTLRGSAVESGPLTSLAALLVAPSSPPFDGASAGYLAHPFVQATLASPAFAALQEARSGDAGFLFAAPALDPAPHVAVAYAGAAPPALAAAVGAPATIDGLLVQAYEGQEATPLVEPLPEDFPADLPQLDAETPVNLGLGDGIGPGTFIIQQQSNGGFRCTANWILQNKATGKLWLGTAGHCWDDPALVLPYRIELCVLNCATDTARVGESTQPTAGQRYVRVRDCFHATFNPSPQPDRCGPIYSSGNGGVGNDFAAIEIPSDLMRLVRYDIPHWGGPTGHQSPGPALGDFLVHYGHGAAFGEVFPTEPRAHLALGTQAGAATHFTFLGASAPGDSGSDVAMGRARGAQGLRGAEATGLLTHISLVFVGTNPLRFPGVTIGTTMDRAITMAKSRGFDLCVVNEQGSCGNLALPPGHGVSLSGTVDARVEDSLLTYGVLPAEAPALPNGIDAGGATGTRILRSSLAGWAGDAVRLAGGSGHRVEGNAIDGGQAGVRLCGTQNSAVTGNRIAATGAAVALCAATTQATLQWNHLGARNGAGLNLDAAPAAPTGLQVDARYNCWDVQRLSLVRARILDEGTGNAVDVVPFLDADCATPILPPTASFAIDPRLTNRVTPVGFTDTSDPGGRALDRWRWEFGDGSTSDQQNPSHTYGALGSFEVRLTVRNAAELEDSAVDRVTVANLKPTANPRSDTTQANRVDAVAFTADADDADGSVASYRWAFGDGATSTAANPTHTYASLGTFTPSLTVTDDDGESATATLPAIAVLNLLPTAEGSADRAATDRLTAVAFDDRSTDRDGTIASRLWAFGDGATSAAEDPTHTYASLGTFTPRLTVTDNDGGQRTLELPAIEVSNLLPTAAGDSDRTTTNRLTAVAFADRSTDADGTIASRRWAFGDGATSDQASPSHTYATLGSFTPTLTVTDNDGGVRSVALPAIAVVNILPVAAGSSDRLSTDRLTAVAFADASTDADGSLASWAWAFGDGATSSARSPSHTYARLGTFTPTLTVRDDDGGEATVALPAITVVNLPPLAAGTSDRALTDRLTAVAFADASTDRDGRVASWAWAFGDGATSSDRNPTHTYPRLGTFTPTLTVTDDDGDAATFTLPAVTVVNIDPTAAFEFAPSPSNRVDLTRFTDGSRDPDGGVVEWRWDLGDGTVTTERQPTHTYAALGSYTVKLTVRDADGGSASVSRVVEVVNLLPSPAFRMNPERPMVLQPTLFEDLSADRDGTVVAWAWDFGDGATSTLKNPVHAYLNGGTYTVTLRVTDNDGGQATATRTVFICAPGANLQALAQLDHIRLEYEACLRVGVPG